MLYTMNVDTGGSRNKDESQELCSCETNDTTPESPQLQQRGSSFTKLDLTLVGFIHQNMNCITVKAMKLAWSRFALSD